MVPTTIVHEIDARRLTLVLEQVRNERGRQDRKWGESNLVYRSLSDGLIVLMEEVGEAARCDLEGNPSDCCDELVQVAAVAVAMVEGFLGRGGQTDIVKDQTTWCPDCGQMGERRGHDGCNPHGGQPA